LIHKKFLIFGALQLIKIHAMQIMDRYYNKMVLTVRPKMDIAVTMIMAQIVSKLLVIYAAQMI
jgi:hypothetical protein